MLPTKRYSATGVTHFAARLDISFAPEHLRRVPVWRSVSEVVNDRSNSKLCVIDYQILRRHESACREATHVGSLSAPFNMVGVRIPHFPQFMKCSSQLLRKVPIAKGEIDQFCKGLVRS